MRLLVRGHLCPGHTHTCFCCTELGQTGVNKECCRWGAFCGFSCFSLAVSGRHLRGAVSAVQATAVPGKHYSLLTRTRCHRDTTADRASAASHANAARPLVNFFTGPTHVTEQQSQSHHQPPAAFARTLLGPQTHMAACAPSPGPQFCKSTGSPSPEGEAWAEVAVSCPCRRPGDLQAGVSIFRQE